MTAQELYDYLVDLGAENYKLKYIDGGFINIVDADSLELNRDEEEVFL